MKFLDFSLKTYTALLNKLVEKKYAILPFAEYLQNSKTCPELRFGISSESKVVILRHDVDRLVANSLVTAKIENEMGIFGTYYFRITPESFNKTIITNIADLGHEIGYHYEDVDLTIKNEKLKIINEVDRQNLIDKAYESFCKNLEKMRSIVEIKTICMHGSPLSKYDNKIIWSKRDAFDRKYDYKNLGILGEPYLDIDWNEFGYLTDTGRRWNGVSVRDKVNNNNSAGSKSQVAGSNQNPEPPIPHPKFKTTFDIINNIDELPDRLMITIHPERWTNNWFLWSEQLVLQNIKNVAKRAIIRGTEK